MKLTEQLDMANEDLLRFAHALPAVLRAIRDGMGGQPGAQSYDSPRVGGHRTVLDEHGIPMPAVSDITGEAACDMASGDDVAAVDLREIQRRVRAVAQHADALIRIAGEWQARSATERERRQTEAMNEPGCELHARIGEWAEAWVLEAQTFGDFTLDRPMRLCRSCHRRIDATHVIPSRADLEHFVTYHKWPKLVANGAGS